MEEKKTAKPLWDKGYQLHYGVSEFTVGDDYIWDQFLLPFDVQASKVHARMLERIGILSSQELQLLITGLERILDLYNTHQFTITASHEDCHTAIESFLTEHYQDVGAKIHTARSRNDQVLTALRLYEKHQLTELIKISTELVTSINTQAERYKNIPLAGYTHMRKAMPTSIGDWLLSFSETFRLDIQLTTDCYNCLKHSPLGSAAGFGVPTIPIDNAFTARELGFEIPYESPLSAQLSRGKMESHILNACSQVMNTCNRLASDLILFSMTEFNYIELPQSFCTGSSIMPQKRNPDVLELIRGKYHQIISLEFQLKSLASNLMTGYHRDLQLTKKALMEGMQITLQSVSIINQLIQGIKINESACQQAMTSELFATQQANQLVLEGIPFRQAYQIIAKKFI